MLLRNAETRLGAEGTLLSKTNARDQLTSDKTDTTAIIDDYLRLTRTVLPSLARREGCDWPIREDHCFQRVVLDTICGGVWYAHLERPAYKHLTRDQAQRAVDLSRAIAEGRADLHQLNRQSLVWRGQQPRSR